jgi:rhodanese-related sulfurtransferase
MMFGSDKTTSQATAHRELTPVELKALQDRNAVVIIDVREPGEFAAEHIPGALNRPLSSFDAAALVKPDDMVIVLQCAGGKRSGMALDKCRTAEAAVDSHLGGGLAAWKAAGLPTVRQG